MRVIHVVPLMSPNMHFGGPIRVALNQAIESLEQGIRVKMIGGATGLPRATQFYFGVPASAYRAFRLIPLAGFITLVSPRLWVALMTLRRSDVDMIHVHLGRDLNTLVACIVLDFRRLPYIVQTHGMIEPRGSRFVRVWDFALTRRALRGARVALTLTPSETREVNRVARRPVAKVFKNAVSVADPSINHEAARVLFLARLHPRKGAEQFARVAVKLAREFPDVDFVIAGPDEGSLRTVSQILDASSGSNVSYIGAVRPDRVADEMKLSSLYVLPAPAEPFGMTILEALAVGTPVVVHQSAALARDLRGAGAAATFDGSDADLESALKALLLDSRSRRRMSEQGVRYIRDNFGITASVAALREHYGKDEK